MNTGDKAGSDNKRSLWQLIIAVLLIVFPLLMLFFNSTRAVKGITWKMPETMSASKQQQKKDNAATLPGQKINSPSFGVYDPEGRFIDNKEFGLEQLFCSWINTDTAALRHKIQGIFSDQRIPVLTIEPWNGPHDKKSLLDDILKGKYDENINKIIKTLALFPGKYYLSWGHEMDQDLTTRYPWSGTEPGSYIKAYRYVTDKFRKNLKNKISWIWSPVGKQGCEKYWPGADYVDYIGMPVYSYPAWDKQFYGHIRSFKSWYEEKYGLVKQFNKPVIIVELGVTGSPDYQTFWLQEAFNDIKVTPSLEMIIFFYAKDEKGSWGKNIETPDWRSNPEVITGLVRWIKQ